MFDRPAPPPVRPGRPGRAPILLQPSNLWDIRRLHEAGRNREALAAAEKLGPLALWAGSEARLLGGDLARALGAPRLGAMLHLRAWRRARNDYNTLAAALQLLFKSRGPWAVWERLRPLRLPEGKQAPAATHQLWLLRAQAAAAFRDFEAADGLWQRAETLAPRAPAVQLVRARILEGEDLFDEALTAARRALELSPTYAPGVALTAHLLQKLGRDDEALAFLQEATTRLESVPLLQQLATLQSALELHRDGLATLDRVNALSPLLEPAGLKWVLALRVQLAWRCGDGPSAVAAARQLGDAASLAFAARAETAGAHRRRVQLEVPFVAQHHATCAPATMAALSRFWNQPITQAEVANEITYGGTSALRQRQWWEQHGWLVRPFTVTWEAACALLKRGVPFELCTLEATSGHAQVVCGFDEVQQTLLIRDPNFRHLRQVAAEPFLQAYRATGPTGLVLLPPDKAILSLLPSDSDKAGLLEGLELPDAPLHELAHRLAEALDQHDHPAARTVVASLQAQAPEHWLTLRAGLSLAQYDGNTALALEYLDRLLARFPGDPRLVLEKLACLAEREQRDERLDLLARLCGQERPHPTFLLRYAQELSVDAREYAAALACVRRAMRLGEVAGGVGCLAALFWQRGRFEEALELFRFSTCLADTQEQAARQYFSAARHLNQTDQALEFLRARFERFGRKSPEPAVSLCTILYSLGHHSEAQEVLQTARQLLPENGALDFFAAQAALHSGQLEAAQAHLQRAQGRVAPALWRRVAARIAEQRGELATALALWREIITAEPLSTEAHAALAQLLAETEGWPAALRHLEETCQLVPWHVPLNKLWFAWQQNEDLLRAEPIVNRLLQLNLRDPEAHRQKARLLAARGKFDEALAAADTAVRLDPTHPQSHAWRARVLLRQGQLDEAQAAFRRAISRAVDYGEYMTELLDCSKTMFARRLVLDFIRNELAAHLIYGDGILTFRALASGHLPAAELLKTLRQLVAQRPDLWHAWAALMRELALHGELSEARTVAESALQRLPDSAPLWSELATLHRVSGNAPAELEAREKALALNPGDTEARCRLADTLDRQGQADRAVALLQEALRLQPRLGFTRLLLAKVLWRQEKRDAALEELKQAIRFAPDYEAAWGLLQVWARLQGHPSLVLELAQQLTAKRPADPAVWLRLARLQLAAHDSDQALASVEKALALHPRGLEAHELRISILTHTGRLDEALAACRSEVWGNSLPPLLQAREASILYARGEQAAAFTALHKALEQTPTLLWGWRLLGSWHQAAGQIPEAEAVARRLLELGWRDADSYFWVAQMKLNANDTPEGVELLERALEVNPDHLPSRVRLMYVQLGTNQPSALSETLRHLARQGALDWVCVGEMALALQRGDLAAALQGMGRLCQMPEAEEQALRNAARALQERGAAAPLEKLLREQLATPAPKPILGALWVEVFLKQSRLPRASEVFQRCLSPELRRCAIQAWLEGINTLPAKSFPFGKLRQDLSRFARAEAEWLQKDVAAWGSYGVALTIARAHAAAAQWFAGWQQRPALPAWVLHNVMNTLVRQGRCAEAIEAGRRALAPSAGRPPADTAWMLAWLEANAGQVEQAEQRLRESQPEQGQTLRQTCQEVIDAVIRVGRASAAEKRKLARSEFGRLRAARDWRGLRTWDLVFRRLFRDSLGLLAAAGAGWTARLWARGRTRRWPWTAGG